MRMAAVALLWWNLFFGFFINLFLDAVDGDIIERINFKRERYQSWDKILDLWLHSSLAVYIYFNFQRDLLWIILLALFIYRLVGLVLFIYTKKEQLLFIFPNIFLDLFMIFLLLPNFVQTNLFLTLVIVSSFSFFKEWWIHIAKLDVTDFVVNNYPGKNRSEA